MASMMWSSFGSAPPKKKVATYGKASARTTNYTLHEDEPAERPRSLTQGSGGVHRQPSTSGGRNNALESVEYIAPVSKKPTASTATLDAPSSSNRNGTHRRVLAKALPVNKAVDADPFEVPSSEDELSSARRPTTEPRTFTKTRPSLQAKANTRPSQTVQPKSVSLKNKASESKLELGNASKRPKTEADVFDVPSSEDDEYPPKRTSRRGRVQPSASRTSPSCPPARSLIAPFSPGSNTDSGSSAAAKKRKSTTNGPDAVDNTTADVAELQLGKKTAAVPQRSSKSRRTEWTTEVGSATTTIKKPRRTRTTTSGKRPAITKGLSSPAKLHGMLTVRESRQPQYPSPVSSIPASPVESSIPEEDATMHDISEPTTPPAIAGSVTPRQNQIWTNLFVDSVATTPGIPNIEKLQLTDRSTPARPAALGRSASDMPRSTRTRKPRLIDSLIRAAPIVEDEEDDSDSDQADPEATGVSAERCSMKTKVPGLERSASTALSGDMEIDSQPVSHSGSSQNAGIGNNGPKITYAKQRSYLEETNVEDDLLFALPMETDSPSNKRRGLGTQSQSMQSNPVAEEEDLEDGSAKVRGIHELRRKGQNYRFEFETQALLDDVADMAGNKSRRRSAMMELCTKMLDDGFLEQLFDSSLGDRFFRSLVSSGEPIFDFSVAVAVCLILKTSRGVDVLDQIFRSNTFLTLLAQLGQDTDVRRIVKDRRTNLSRVGQEDVIKFRNLVQASSMWSEDKPQTVSPRVVALRSLDLLVVGLRKAGNTESLLSDGDITTLLEIASGACGKVKVGAPSAADALTLNLVFSILEAASMCKGKQEAWPSKMLESVAELTPSFFGDEGRYPTKLSIRLCINLTNNNVKACESFAGPSFVKPLVQSINDRFDLLSGSLEEEQRLDVLETAILSLGAMINLAEFSDKARASVSSCDDALLDALVKSFLDGCERAAQADSMEESHTNVATGYLTVLLGNLCLNESVRLKVRKRLPKRNLDAVINGVQEFIYYNEKVDQTRMTFEDDEEGRETWSKFTQRLHAVVDRLRVAET